MPKATRFALGLAAGAGILGGTLGVLPSAALAQSYGGGPGISISTGGGGGSFVPTVNVNPVSVSVSPVKVAPRVAPPAPPAPVIVQAPPVIVNVPPPVEQVAGRVAAPPEVPAVAPPPPEVPAVVAPPVEEAPPSIVRPPVVPVEEVAGRPPVAPGPGLTVARVLPRAGDGPLNTLLWPPALLALAAAGIAALAGLWPRGRRAEPHA